MTQTAIRMIRTRTIQKTRNQKSVRFWVGLPKPVAEHRYWSKMSRLDPRWTRTTKPITMTITTTAATTRWSQRQHHQHKAITHPTTRARLWMMTRMKSKKAKLRTREEMAKKMIIAVSVAAAVHLLMPAPAPTAAIVAIIPTRHGHPLRMIARWHHLLLLHHHHHHHHHLAHRHHLQRQLAKKQMLWLLLLAKTIIMHLPPEEHHNEINRLIPLTGITWAVETLEILIVSMFGKSSKRLLTIWMKSRHRTNPQHRRQPKEPR